MPPLSKLSPPRLDPRWTWSSPDHFLPVKELAFEIVRARARILERVIGRDDDETFVFIHRQGDFHELEIVSREEGDPAGTCHVVGVWGNGDLSPALRIACTERAHAKAIAASGEIEV